MPGSGRFSITLWGCACVISILFFAGIAFASSAGGHGPVEAKEWLNTDWYRVMNFAVLAVGLFLILRKPVSQALSSRIKGIKDQLSELEIQKKNAEKTLAQYNEKISHLEQEASKIIAQYEEQGKAAKQRILEEATAAAAKLEEHARRNIDNEFKLAKVKLQEEIIGKALAKAEELVHKSITSDDQERLVDEYINKVVA
ncbi:MAG: ATP synthase F0 subunit B [Proteobacteria bacterium]|nr:ATP synthase F0 subunit B [Pseudomonadota bacterium]